MTACPNCGDVLEIGSWPYCGPGGHASIYRQQATTVHPNERTVVYENPATGQVRYPGRADRAIPERYAKQGFVRKEFETRRSLEQFEKKHNVVNERMWFDSNGKSFDDA